jgi:hypothetical protein
MFQSSEPDPECRVSIFGWLLTLDPSQMLHAPGMNLEEFDAIVLARALCRPPQQDGVVDKIRERYLLELNRPSMGKAA